MLSDLSADELAAEIERQGAAYSAYVNGFRDNGVTGEIAKEYLDGDLDELFDDLSITSKLHRKALRKLFEGLDGRARRESVASADSASAGGAVPSFSHDAGWDPAAPEQPAVDGEQLKKQAAALKTEAVALMKDGRKVEAVEKLRQAKELETQARPTRAPAPLGCAPRPCPRWLPPATLCVRVRTGGCRRRRLSAPGGAAEVVAGGRLHASPQAGTGSPTPLEDSPPMRPMPAGSQGSEAPTAACGLAVASGARLSCRRRRDGEASPRCPARPKRGSSVSSAGGAGAIFQQADEKAAEERAQRREREEAEAKVEGGACRARGPLCLLAGPCGRLEAACTHPRAPPLQLGSGCPHR